MSQDISYNRTTLPYCPFTTCFWWHHKVRTSKHAQCLIMTFEFICATSFFKKLFWSFKHYSGTFYLLRGHSITFLGTGSNAFSRSTKTYGFFFLSLNFSCNCFIIKIASVVDLIGQKPNCQPSTFIKFLNLSSNTFSNNFIPCPSSLIALYFLHSKAFFPLEIGIITLFFYSGISPSSTILLNTFFKSHVISALFIKSLAIPVGPGAFPFFISFNALLTSSSDTSSIVPSTISISFRLCSFSLFNRS